MIGFDSFKSKLWKPKEDFKLNRNTREIVTPEMNTWEKTDVKDLYNMQKEQYIEKLRQGKTADGKSFPEEFVQKVQEKIEKMPDYLLYNMRNMYNITPDIRRMGNTKGDNAWQFNLLQKTDNYYLKGLTYNSEINSGLASSNIMYNIARKMVELNIDEEDMEQAMKGMFGEGQGEGEGEGEGEGQGQGQGQGGGGGSMSKDEIQDMMDKASQETKSDINDVEDLQDMYGGEDNTSEGQEEQEKERQKNPGGSAPGKQDGEIDIQSLKELRLIQQSVGEISISKQDIDHFVRTIQSKATAYFSSNYKIEEESLFESDEFDEILDLEELLPIFRKAHIEDLSVEERKYFMGFDIYLDSSGSMSSSIPFKNVKGDIKHIPAISLGKICGLRLMSFGYAEDLYHFDNSLTKTNKATFAQLFKHGGTNLNRVIQNVLETEKPSVVITDGCDWVSGFSPADMKNVFFLTLAGGIPHFETEEIRDAVYSGGQMSCFEDGQFHAVKTYDEHQQILGGRGGYW